MAGFLLRTRWTWDEYMATPDDVVEDMLLLMSAEAEWQRSEMKRLEVKSRG